MVTNSIGHFWGPYKWYIWRKILWFLEFDNFNFDSFLELVLFVFLVKLKQLKTVAFSRFFFLKKIEHFYVDFFRLKKVYSPSLSSQRRKKRACMLNFSFRSFFQVVLRSCRVATSRPRPSQSRPSYCVKQSTKKEPQFSVAWISSSKS